MTKFEEFEDERVASRENAIHSKEFEKSEDGRTMSAILRMLKHSSKNSKMSGSRRAKTRYILKNSKKSEDGRTMAAILRMLKHSSKNSKMSGSRRAKTRYIPKNSKIRSWKNHANQSSNFLHNPKNSKMNGSRGAKTRHTPKNSKNSKMEEPWPPIFEFSAHFEEFEEERSASRQNAIHSKEFEKFEDGRTMSAKLRICAWLRAPLLPPEFEDWRPWFFHLRIFRILWNVSHFVASRSVPLRILRIVQGIRRLVAMVLPSSDFSNSLECVAFSRVATHSSSISSDSASNSKIVWHGSSIFGFFEFFGMYSVLSRREASFFEFFELCKISEDWRPWFFHLRIFRILWNVSRFRASRPIHLRILRIMRAIRRLLGMVLPSSDFSNSLECIAFARVATFPTSNSSNCERIFEDWRAWFHHLRIFRILWNVSRFVASRTALLRIRRSVLKKRKSHSKINFPGESV